MIPAPVTLVAGPGIAFGLTFVSIPESKSR
jgi:hypothetical protein